MNRRAQKPITIRSDRAAARLSLLTRNGLSQAQVIEEALERMPVPAKQEWTPEEADRFARITAILERIPPNSFPTMIEFDALEYDDDGLPR